MEPLNPPYYNDTQTYTTYISGCKCGYESEAYYTFGEAEENIRDHWTSEHSEEES